MLVVNPEARCSHKCGFVGFLFPLVFVVSDRVTPTSTATTAPPVDFAEVDGVYEEALGHMSLVQKTALYRKQVLPQAPSGIHTFVSELGPMRGEAPRPPVSLAAALTDGDNMFDSAPLITLLQTDAEAVGPEGLPRNKTSHYEAATASPAAASLGLTASGDGNVTLSAKDVESVLLNASNESSLASSRVAAQTSSEKAVSPLTVLPAVSPLSALAPAPTPAASPLVPVPPESQSTQADHASQMPHASQLGTTAGRAGGTGPPAGSVTAPVAIQSNAVPTVRAAARSANVVPAQTQTTVNADGMPLDLGSIGILTLLAITAAVLLVLLVGITVLLLNLKTNATESGLENDNVGIRPHSAYAYVAGLPVSSNKHIEKRLPKMSGYDCTFSRPVSSGCAMRFQVRVEGPLCGVPLTSPLSQKPCVLYSASASASSHGGVNPMSVAYAADSQPFVVSLLDAPDVKIEIKGDEVALFDMSEGFVTQKANFNSVPNHWQAFALSRRLSAAHNSPTTSRLYNEDPILEFQECVLFVGAQITCVGELHRRIDGMLTLHPWHPMIGDAGAASQPSWNTSWETPFAAVANPFAGKVLASDAASLAKKDRVRSASVLARLGLSWGSSTARAAGRAASSKSDTTRTRTTRPGPATSTPSDADASEGTVAEGASSSRGEEGSVTSDGPHSDE